MSDYDHDKHVVRYSIGVGSGLGKVKAKRTTWARLRSLLSEPMVDTSVAFAEYMALDQDAKLVKKRAPGNWLAAHFEDGRRKLDKQKFRSMVVFDLDYVTVEQLDFILDRSAEINEFHWFMHTTRAHCPEAPRVRLILLADRTMNAEETHAITRLLALYLADDPEVAIEIPDLISFRYNQTMFLPSRSKGQEFWTDENVAPILNVDKFLAENPGWEDYTTLPYQEAEQNRGVVDPSRRMESPTEKRGVMGAWCRTYTVDDVIAEFIPEIYEPGASATETRYTYTLGSGSNGAVSYDDGLFLHSNHATDPIEGSANAWDLARIHLFGHLDEKTSATTTPGNMPSFKRMAEFANKDPAVLGEIYAHMGAGFDADEDEDEDDEPSNTQKPQAAPVGKPREGAGPSVDDLLGDTDEVGDDPLPASDPSSWDANGDDDDVKPEKKKKIDMSWTADFRRKANGDLEPVLNNIALICQHDPRLKHVIGYNEFTHDPVAFKKIRDKKIHLPSNPVIGEDRKNGRRWEDADDTSIKLIASANGGRSGWETDFSAQAIQEAVLAAGTVHPIHPVKNDIEECHARWLADGAPSGLLDRVPQEFLGCEDTIFHRESSAKFFIGAVARIYEPGCKFDQMVILEGETGGGKSTLWKVFAGGHFSEFRVDLDNLGRTVEAMRGNWFLELAEMAVAKRADANTLKDFLSATSDTVRLAYAHREFRFKRQSVMVATSNDDDYLTDPTSVRRYWVWKTDATEFNQIDIARLKRVRHHVIGEAYHRYRELRKAQPSGELHLALETREAIQEARDIAQGSRRQTVTETIADSIQEWLDLPVKACDIETDESGFAPEDASDELMVRNMVTARDCFEALRTDAVLASYRNADVRTYGKALKSLEGWSELGKRRRHGRAPTVWFYREDKDEFWVPAPEETPYGQEGSSASVDDLLG